jgi:hypothetical protein
LEAAERSLRAHPHTTATFDLDLVSYYRNEVGVRFGPDIPIHTDAFRLTTCPKHKLLGLLASLDIDLAAAIDLNARVIDCKRGFMGHRQARFLSVSIRKVRKDLEKSIALIYFAKTI